MGENHDWRGSKLRVAVCIVLQMEAPEDRDRHHEDAPDMNTSSVTLAFIHENCDLHPPFLSSLDNAQAAVHGVIQQALFHI